jgi:hypothetical protein
VVEDGRMAGFKRLTDAGTMTVSGVEEERGGRRERKRNFRRIIAMFWILRMVRLKIEVDSPRLGEGLVEARLGVNYCTSFSKYSSIYFI